MLTKPYRVSNALHTVKVYKVLNDLAVKTAYTIKIFVTLPFFKLLFVASLFDAPFAKFTIPKTNGRTTNNFRNIVRPCLYKTKQVQIGFLNEPSSLFCRIYYSAMKPNIICLLAASITLANSVCIQEI